MQLKVTICRSAVEEHLKRTLAEGSSRIKYERRNIRYNKPHVRWDGHVHGLDLIRRVFGGIGRVSRW